MAEDEKAGRWRVWDRLTEAERSFAIGWIITGLTDAEFAEAVNVACRNRSSSTPAER